MYVCMYVCTVYMYVVHLLRRKRNQHSSLYFQSEVIICDHFSLKLIYSRIHAFVIRMQ